MKYIKLFEDDNNFVIQEKDQIMKNLEIILSSYRFIEKSMRKEFSEYKILSIVSNLNFLGDFVDGISHTNSIILTNSHDFGIDCDFGLDKVVDEVYGDKKDITRTFITTKIILEGNDLIDDPWFKNTINNIKKNNYHITTVGRCNYDRISNSHDTIVAIRLDMVETFNKLYKAFKIINK